MWKRSAPLGREWNLGLLQTHSHTLGRGRRHREGFFGELLEDCLTSQCQSENVLRAKDAPQKPSAVSPMGQAKMSQSCSQAPPSGRGFLRALEIYQSCERRDLPFRLHSEEHSLSSYTSESFDDNASIVTVIRLVNDAVNNIENEVSNMDKEPRRNSPASHWESSSQSASWLSPSRLRPPEIESQYDLEDTQQSIRRGGSTRSLQLDYRVMSYTTTGDRGRARGSGKRMFQWERNQSGEWERRRVLNCETKNNEPDSDMALCSDSPVYEEYRETKPGGQATEGLYDTLPPTRPAYEGYPSSPPASTFTRPSSFPH
ncbi:hypothetical protein WMY93_008228 [Mugilogobius chulae]|uniref:Brain-enriched guanylate kinase-associated protein n=1 Tax=Mugilogobius chulae TaxID=88201 RepID=A0AAW0PPB6_9GOBI